MAQRRKLQAVKKAADVVDPVDEDRNFMEEQRDADEAEGRWGEASKAIKRTAILLQEASRRIAASRSETSPPEAQVHDLRRIVEIAHSVTTEAQRAAELLDV